VPDVRDHTRAIRRALDDLLPYRPDLVAVEPGRHLVAESAVLVASVLAREERAGEEWLHLDVGAYNGLMETQQTASQWQFPLWPRRGPSSSASPEQMRPTRPDPRRRRLVRLSTAGLVDSAGLALGWTVFTLHAAATQGLGIVAVYHVAMYVGIALSAPWIRWATRRVSSRALLRGLVVAEAVLRLAGILLLAGGAPVPLVAATVLVQYVAAWSGYALMRAEVAAVDPGAASMTWYGVCIGATEAVAAALAALVPEDAHGFTGPVLAAVAAVYAASLLPTWLVARDAASRPAGPRMAGAVPPLPLRRLVGGMALAAGPTLLAVPLADALAGRPGIVVAALAFTAGSLAAPAAARVAEVLPPPAAWPLLGGLMVGGWVLAPAHIAGLAAAQFLSGVAFTALEGATDARLLHTTGSGAAELAHAGAARALGGAAAVAAIPSLIVVLPLADLAALLAAALAAAAATGTGLIRPGSGRRRLAAFARIQARPRTMSPDRHAA